MTCLASAQLHPHFGIVAGVPLTDTLTSSESGSTAPTSAYFDRFNSKTKRLLIGPAFRLDLPGGLGLEFDAIYQRVNSDSTAQSSSPPSFASYSFQQTTANRWQFPFLVQYAHALPRSKTRMFVEFGPSISHIDGGQSTVHQITTEPSTTLSVSSFTGQGETQAGVTAGAGIDITMFHLHLRPRFRYSHWFSGNATSQTAILGGVLLSNPWANYPGGAVVYPGTSASGFLTKSNEASLLLDILF
jgi:hypothetical protein